MAKDLLAFPITHMTRDLAFDEPAYRAHLDWIVKAGPAAVFSAGGTGEFFSLTPDEVETVTRATVQDVNGKLPVISGAGYGTAIAIDLAKRAERAGADGILLLPPYIVNASQAGLIAHVEAVCRSTSLGVIVYNRDNAILDADSVARLCDCALSARRNGSGQRRVSYIEPRASCVNSVSSASAWLAKTASTAARS